MDTSERITLRLPSELLARVQAAASSDLRSVNSEIVWLIESGLSVRIPAGRGGTGGQAYIGRVVTNEINPGGGQTTETPDQGDDDDRDDA
jgi:hypothetical protein